uniref:Uncharacterized protein n=1 Tax=Nelumbo nucifera TaxID=4432 RepID=A0A822YTU0_NELNU|nr:TPA_asm: hypothetical protein HUJ06_005460 [Nelumbo nucifera]
MRNPKNKDLGSHPVRKENSKIHLGKNIGPCQRVSSFVFSHLLPGIPTVIPSATFPASLNNAIFPRHSRISKKIIENSVPSVLPRQRVGNQHSRLFSDFRLCSSRFAQAFQDLAETPLFLSRFAQAFQELEENHLTQKLDM